MRNLLNQSKVQLSLFLLLIYALNIAFNFSLNLLLTGIISVAVAVASEFVFVKIRKIKQFFPSAAIATGLIIALLTDPNLPMYFPALASFVAILGKNFLRMGRHIFNPAAFGLLIVSLVAGAAVSWWGVSWQIPNIQDPLSILFFLVLLSPGYLSLIKMRRWKITLSFLATYTLMLSAFFKNPQFLFLDPTIVFFSIVMLPEPMTSPNNSSRQIMYGVFVGTLALVLSTIILPPLNFFSLDPIILALLIGNLVFFRYR